MEKKDEIDEGDFIVYEILVFRWKFQNLMIDL